MKILICFGTRPEAIKMAPLFHELKKHPFEVRVCVTAQHRDMLDQVLDFFEIIPDYDLNVMQPNQSLSHLSATILSKMDAVIQEVKPEWVLVHGDTTTSSMVALTAFYKGVKVGHIEAGLRTYDKHNPFPEEINRQITARIANVHFTPTRMATQNLLNEGTPAAAIVQTGNTVVDALFWTLDKINTKGYYNQEIESLQNTLQLNKKIILVTGHRRESFGLGLQNLCEALLDISKRADVCIVYPVHLNPNVKDAVYDKLSNISNIHLLPPVSYPVFVWLMQQAFMIVTDSGGIQEEAPSLGKPVLVTRTVSERPEGIEQGFSRLVGTDKKQITDTVHEILDNFTSFKNQKNPYGDGDASQKIVTYFLNKN